MWPGLYSEQDNAVFGKTEQFQGDKNDERLK